MYNQIPSERTSKRAIFIALLFCITLVSVLAAGYFAWMAKDLQGRIAQDGEVLALDHDSEFKSLDVDPIAVPVYSFTYPEAIQVVSPTEVPEGRTFLSVVLNDWEEANKDMGYCENVRGYATYEKVNQYSVTAQQALTDDGIRAALVAYFQVAPEFEEDFFAGIESAIDEDDRFALGNMMCSAGSRRFLLLEDLHGVIRADGTENIQAFPEILTWENHTTPYWTFYPVSEYRALDGYIFIPDWNGLAVLGTGYGDAGYSHWEYQFLQDVPGEHALSLVEKCNTEPTDDYQDSIMTCEVEYTP